MAAVRIDRLLASTAIALLISGTAAGSFAQTTTDDAPAAISQSTDPAPASIPGTDTPAAGTAQAAPQPAGGTDQDAKPGAETTPADTAITTPEPNPPAADTAAAAPAASPSADSLVGEQLRNLANGKFDAMIGKQDAITIDAFYSGRNYAPIWITDGKANARAKAAIDYLAHVDADGLEPADYPVASFEAAGDAAALADAEIRLTMSVIAYAHHASVGQVHWSRVSGDIFYEQKPPAPADVLAAMVSAADVGAALAAYEPQAPAYLALKAKLAELRGGSAIEGKAPVPDGPVLKIGMKDDRVPQLFGRLGVAGDSGTTYDKGLADAVRKFQQDHKLPPTGTLTQATVDALNGRQGGQAADIIIANMERWRWMPRDLGKTYVIVNLANFTLRVIDGGRQVWTTKIVDGKPSTPTPIMSAEMRSITVNPTWNVPPSIANNEYIPLLRQDPTILTRMGLIVTQNPDGSLHLAQPPGDNNALGRLRFNFPNKFLVYQHDSNEKYLFSNPMRASSHGCMRVEDPLKYAEVLLSLERPGEGYTEDRIRRMYSNSEQDIHFPNLLPVHLTYQTAYVDDDGKLQFREDVYGRDRALLEILKSDQRKVADTPIERRDNAVRRELLAMPEGAFGRGWSGQNFFQRLFSGFAFGAAPQPAYQRGHVAQQHRTDLR
jgi:L,D-transpeptidase YcbB